MEWLESCRLSAEGLAVGLGINSCLRLHLLSVLLQVLHCCQPRQTFAFLKRTPPFSLPCLYFLHILECVSIPTKFYQQHFGFQGKSKIPVPLVPL